ncbi:MAG: metal-sensing transcriptional repressor, partial [Lachnospiraceae bacterium]|nr:metal-sensing transcriptional repressor [Lachnospiraceae bacterium]
MRTKVRDDSEHRDLINRLRRIEGQIRGIEGMIDNDAYCTDVLTQVVAVRSAMG